MKTVLSRWLPVIFWMLVIFAISASSDPYRALPAGWRPACLGMRLGAWCQEEMLGRAGHVVEYAILGWLACRAAIWQNKANRRKLALAIALAGGYALLDETHQFFVAGRAFQALDLGLDWIGVMLGAVVFLLSGTFLFRISNRNETAKT